MLQFDVGDGVINSKDCRIQPFALRVNGQAKKRLHDRFMASVSFQEGMRELTQADDHRRR
jgi:hypothetical protein